MISSVFGLFLLLTAETIVPPKLGAAPKIKGPKVYGGVTVDGSRKPYQVMGDLLRQQPGDI